MILDFFMILIGALFILFGYKMGLVKALYGLISLVVAGFLSYFLSNLAAPWLYRCFFQNKVTESISESVSSAVEGTAVTAESIFNNLPEAVKNIFNIFGITESSLVNSMDSTVQSSTQAVVTSVDNTVSSMVITILSVVLIVLTFILVLIFMKVISKFVLSIFKLPVIKQINGILGGALGLCEGIIFCFVVVLICKLLIPVADDPIITTDMINQSTLFKSIYNSGFLNVICGIWQ